MTADMEQADVDRWVDEQLERDGFDAERRDLLIAAGTDYHDAERLLAQGCPPDLVISILT